MKKIMISLSIIVLAGMCGITSAYAEGYASGDADNPTELTLNTYVDSYLYTGHPADYYTFTLSSDKQVLIECNNISETKEYCMTLSGNGIEPIYTKDSTDNNAMYLTANLSAGTYNVSVTGNFASGAMKRLQAVANSGEEESYHIAVFDNIKSSGYVIDDSDYTFIDNDFEDSDISDWLDGFRPHYVYGNKEIESEANGNKYVAFTPVNSSQYYIFEAKDVYATSVLCSEFDIKFTSGNMEIQARQADSNLDVNFKMAGRIRKYAYYLQYYSNGAWKYMLDSSGGWLKLTDVSKWYTLRMTFDIRTDKYSIYLEDRDSGEVLSQVVEESFGEECELISYLAFSSLSKLCIDNVKIFESETDVAVEGWTYIKIPQDGTRQYHYFNRLSPSKKAWSADSWSLLYSKEGISIDENTGILSVSENAKPGTAIVRASRKYYPWISSTYLVDIDR